MALLTDDRKNLIINGNFDFWQRGIAGTTGYLADRFFSTSGVESYTQESAAGLVSGSTYFARISRTTGSAGTVELVTRIEQKDIMPFEGKNITLAFLAKTTSGTPELKIRYGHATAGVDNFATVAFSSQSLGNLSTSFQLFHFTFLVTADMADNGLQVQFGDDVGVGPLTFDFAQVRLTEGDVPAPFVRAGNNIAHEYALCLRYYEQIQHFFVYGANATTMRFIGQFKVQKRTPGVTLGATSVGPGIQVFDDLGYNQNNGNLTISNVSTNDFSFHVSATGYPGVTTARVYLHNPGADASFLTFDAEL